MTLLSKTSKGNGLVYHAVWLFKQFLKQMSLKTEPSEKRWERGGGLSTIDTNTLPAKR